MDKKTTLLVILDGWGYRKYNKDNAINNAITPNWDSIRQNSDNTLLDASGLMVGLPKGQIGNSEVGHINIGSGRIVYQNLTRIDKSIEDRTLFKKEILCESLFW